MKDFKRWIYFLIILSAVPLISLLHTGLPLTHDGQDHVARIANFYQSLAEGNLIPRWAGDLNWGYGHPILMFLYPLPSYLASLFHFIGFSFVNSIKLVFAISYLASVLAMYLFVKDQWGKHAGFVAAVLYGFAPYRFVDLYVRGAIGEHLAFVFMPLVLLALTKLAYANNSDNWWRYWLSLFIAGLVLSHNAISLMFAPIVILYLLYLYIYVTKKDIKFLILTSVYLLLGLLLSAFFWFPAFFEGKYTLRDIVTKGEYDERFVDWKMFFYSPWNFGGGNEFTKEVGLLHWLSVVISLASIKKLISKDRILLLIFLGVFLIPLFLMLNWSNDIWSTFTLLQKFQFPWRFLTITVFASSVVGGLLVAKIFTRHASMLVIFVALASLFLTRSMWKPKDYLYKPEAYFTGIYEGTTDTGESSPIWSVRFMERLALSQLEAIDNNLDIENIKRTSVLHQYKAIADRRTRLLENTLYFPGWNVYVNGKPVELEFQDQNFRGLITFYIEKGENLIQVKFEDTKLRKFANWLTIFGSIYFVGSLSFLRYKSSKKL